MATADGQPPTADHELFQAQTTSFGAPHLRPQEARGDAHVAPLLASWAILCGLRGSRGQGRVGLSQPQDRGHHNVTDKAAINWAVTMGYADLNPIGKMEKPTPAIRQEFVSPDQWPKLLAASQTAVSASTLGLTGMAPRPWQGASNVSASFMSEVRTASASASTCDGGYAG